MAGVVLLQSRSEEGVPPDLSGAARLSARRVMKALDTGEDGLSSAEASRRLVLHGPNVLRYHHVTAMSVLVRQLRNPLLLLLLLCAAVSGFTGDPTDAAASVFLSFLPMLPSQILLNNLLYNAGQLAIPTDAVDPDALSRPAAWDIGFVRRFMFVFGPVSSIFDFLTFFVMLGVLHATVGTFRTGWFVESLATQTLVVYVIRTRRIPFFRSRPSNAMLVVPTTCALAGAIVPFTPIAAILGFTPLPVVFFAILLGMIVTYLALVELAKSAFYNAHPHPFPRVPTTHLQRLEHGVLRRVGHFTRHSSPPSWSA